MAEVWGVIPSEHKAVLTYQCGRNIVISPEMSNYIAAHLDEIAAELQWGTQSSPRHAYTPRTPSQRWSSLDDERGYSDDKDDPWYDIRATAMEREEARLWMAERADLSAWTVGAPPPPVPACVLRSLRWSDMTPGLWGRTPTWGQILDSWSNGGPGVSAATHLRDHGRAYVWAVEA